MLSVIRDAMARGFITPVHWGTQQETCGVLSQYAVDKKRDLLQAAVPRFHLGLLRD